MHPIPPLKACLRDNQLAAQQTMLQLGQASVEDASVFMPRHYSTHGRPMQRVGRSSWTCPLGCLQTGRGIRNRKQDMSSFRDVIKEQFQQDNCTANVAYDATQEKDHTGRERETLTNGNILINMFTNKIKEIHQLELATLLVTLVVSDCFPRGFHYQCLI